MSRHSKETIRRIIEAIEEGVQKYPNITRSRLAMYASTSMTMMDRFEEEGLFTIKLPVRIKTDSSFASARGSHLHL